jgi:Putative Flp pilus-assembly TadE/G-like
MKVHGVACNRNGERGISLVLVAFGMTMFIAAAAFAIDLASLYVGKSEAQRAADAAALAGARQIVASGAISGTLTGNTCPTALQTEAIAAGNQNLVGGQSPGITASNVACDFSRAGDPLVTVSFTATSPVFFIKYFGSTYNSNNVSATATAEAYDPSGATTGPTFCSGCLKPFLVPNCDYTHLLTAGGNSNCPLDTATGKHPDYFFTPPNNSITHPGVAPGGVVGELWTLHSNAGPSQWNEIAFDSVPPACKGGETKTGFEKSVESCSTKTYTCGSQLCALDGAAFGPNGHSVGCLITYGVTCNNQDVTATDSITVNTANTPPFTITAGSGNPFFPASSKITQSAAIVSVVVFDGIPVPSGGGPVVVVGYMRMFIKDINHMGPVDNLDTVILSISGCGVTGGNCSSGAGTASGGGANLVPIRLVHQ